MQALTDEFNAFASHRAWLATANKYGVPLLLFAITIVGAYLFQNDTTDFYQLAAPCLSSMCCLLVLAARSTVARITEAAVISELLRSLQPVDACTSVECADSVIPVLLQKWCRERLPSQPPTCIDQKKSVIKGEITQPQTQAAPDTVQFDLLHADQNV